MEPDQQPDPGTPTSPAPWAGRPWARSEAVVAGEATADAAVGEEATDTTVESAPEPVLPTIEDLRGMAADLDDIDDILHRLDDDDGPDGVSNAPTSVPSSAAVAHTGSPPA